MYANFDTTEQTALCSVELQILLVSSVTAAYIISYRLCINHTDDHKLYKHNDKR